LLASGIVPAQAADIYPLDVSALYASPVVKRGYAAVGISATGLPSGLSVRASRGRKATVARVSVNSAATTGTAIVKVGALLPTTAGRYPVVFRLQGGPAGTDVITSQTYTVGKAITIKSFAVKASSTRLSVSGKAAKNTPVKVSVKIGSKTTSKTVKAGAGGKFSVRFAKKAKVSYTVTARVAANKKYFSDTVTKTYAR
jgi:hypothetical protein